MSIEESELYVICKVKIYGKEMHTYPVAYRREGDFKSPDLIVVKCNRHWAYSNKVPRKSIRYVLYMAK